MLRKTILALSAAAALGAASQILPLEQIGPKLLALFADRS